MRRLLIFYLISLSYALAQPITIKAEGEATVSLRADRSRVRFDVATSGRSAERAREQNAERSNRVIAALQNRLGNAVTIRTARFTLRQNYGAGFAAIHTIEVSLTDAAQTGAAIDAATKEGGAAVGNVESIALDELQAKSHALGQATSNARAHAEAMAAALGLRIARVTGVETLAAPPPTVRSGGVHVAAKRSRTPTSLTMADVEARARVVLTAEAVE